eukprot:CAMPEP_0178949600 /NCGR_PEP_ID=MMETSP0789-20121207/6145_1 /TAXON_ID=3005 /ORGANISM="Rhizosolenia setigera, Strain CCMP 1694" /LENGTH=125 /DNA_ID=CAMNT_0020630149 /DNA_START=161 /DNA_END=541 /DNA_ORIENTATION=-
MALNSYDINYDDGTMIMNNNKKEEVLTSKQKVVVGKGNLRSSDKNNIRNLDSEDGLPGPWPECIRRSFWYCKELIEEELVEISSEEDWEIQTIHENRPVTMDYRETRVRIFFNNFGRVVDAPMIG